MALCSFYSEKKEYWLGCANYISSWKLYSLPIFVFWWFLMLELSRQTKLFALIISAHKKSTFILTGFILNVLVLCLLTYIYSGCAWIWILFYFIFVQTYIRYIYTYKLRYTRTQTLGQTHMHINYQLKVFLSYLCIYIFM